MTLEYGCGKLRRGGRYKLYEILDYLRELAGEADELKEKLESLNEILEEYYVKRREESIVGMSDSDFH